MLRHLDFPVANACSSYVQTNAEKKQDGSSVNQVLPKCGQPVSGVTQETDKHKCTQAASTPSGYWDYTDYVAKAACGDDGWKQSIAMLSANTLGTLYQISSSAKIS